MIYMFERPYQFFKMIWWKMDWHTKNIKCLKTLISGACQKDAGKNHLEFISVEHNMS